MAAEARAQTQGFVRGAVAALVFWLAVLSFGAREDAPRTAAGTPPFLGMSSGNCDGLVVGAPPAATEVVASTFAPPVVSTSATQSHSVVEPDASSPTPSASAPADPSAQPPAVVAAIDELIARWSDQGVFARHSLFAGSIHNFTEQAAHLRQRSVVAAESLPGNSCFEFLRPFSDSVAEDVSFSTPCVSTSAPGLRAVDQGSVGLVAVFQRRRETPSVRVAVTLAAAAKDVVGTLEAHKDDLITHLLRPSQALMFAATFAAPGTGAASVHRDGGVAQLRGAFGDHFAAAYVVDGPTARVRITDAFPTLALLPSNYVLMRAMLLRELAHNLTRPASPSDTPFDVVVAWSTTKAFVRNALRVSASAAQEEPPHWRLTCGDAPPAPVDMGVVNDTTVVLVVGDHRRVVAAVSTARGMNEFTRLFSIAASYPPSGQAKRFFPPDQDEHRILREGARSTATLKQTVLYPASSTAPDGSDALCAAASSARGG